MRPERTSGKLAAGGLALGVLLACAAPADSPGPPAGSRPSPTAAAASNDGVLVLTGTLRATESERLVAPTTSTWQLSLQWLADEGATVSPGDPVARFDPGAAQATLRDTRDRYEERRQDGEARAAQDAIRRLELELALRKAEVEYEKARIDAAVPESLLAGKEYRDRAFRLRRAEQAFEDAQLDLLDHDAGARSRASETEIELAELEREISHLEEELDSLTLRARRAGFVLHEEHRWFGRPVRVGDRLQATMPVASIPEPGAVEVEAWAGETDAVRLQPGMRVALRLDADPSRLFEGRVDRVGTAGERREAWGRGSYRHVAVGVAGVDPEIMRPGMSVRCEVWLRAAAESTRASLAGDAR